MSGSVAIVGAGQIGCAVARAFLASGWRVSVHARSEPSWIAPDVPVHRWDRESDAPPTADCVIDTIAFDAVDVVSYSPGDIGRLIVVSSASVYRDQRGRTLDEAAVNGFPEFPGPITEEHPTVAAGDATYSTRKVRMERAALERFGDRATILRPCAVHGPYSRHPREWWFVKRLLDGRRRIPLKFGETSRFQTTSTASLGRAAVMAATNEAIGIHNVSDADAPSVRKIGGFVAEHLEREVDWIDVADDIAVGQTPWSIPRPMIVRQSPAFETATYRRTAGAAIDWLAKQPSLEWERRFPVLAGYPWRMFDYAAEDDFLACT